MIISPPSTSVMLAVADALTSTSNVTLYAPRAAPAVSSMNVPVPELSMVIVPKATPSTKTVAVESMG